MFRPTSSFDLSGRARTIAAAGLALAAFLAVAAWSSSARASGCTNTFTNTAGGSWGTAGNWSKKSVPTASEEACITEPGTYTVEMAQGTVTVKTLTVGASSGAQTLAVESTSSQNADLITSEGLAIGAHGAVSMTNDPGDGDTNNVTISSSVNDAGTLSSEAGKGGSRTIAGSLTNTGTLAVNANTEYNGEAATLTNEGSLTLAEGKTLKVSGKSAAVNGAGGKIAATGTGEVLVTGSTASFTEGAGSTSGALPVVLDDSSLSYTGSGASTIALRGTSALGGNLAAGQSLLIQSTSSENNHTDVAASLTNAGAITLTNASDGDTNSASLEIAKGQTLANSGSLTSEPGKGGGRSVEGNLTNTGTLAVNTNTEYNGAGATLTNEGTIELANEKQLGVTSKGKVVNAAGGKVAAAGSGEVLVHGSETSFTEGAGSTSGALPVVLDDSSLSYTGSGASTIALRGTSALGGNLAAGQSLLIQSTSSENNHTDVAASLTNAGAITLTNASDGDTNSASLEIAKGQTLANSGSLTSEPGKGGGRSVEGNLTNTGTLAVNTNTEYNGAGATLTNEGTIVIANEKALTAPAADKVINAAAGNIEGLGSGKLSQRTGSFEQAAGKTTGTLPVVLDDLALSYAGTGASTIALRGTSTLSGRPSAGQTLSLQSTSSENTSVSAASFTNGGKLVLTNAADGDANSVALALAGGTLTNAKGAKLLVEHANGGSRTIEGSLVNEGTGAVTATAAGGQTLRVTGSFKQAGKKPILETTVAGASAFGALQVTGAATLAGELKLVQVKPFVPTVGEKFVILTGSAVSGTFKKVKGNKIKKAPAKLYAPIYGASSLTLEAQA